MKKIIIEIICILFIILFVYAAAFKLMDIQKFKIQLGQSPLLTNQAQLAAWSIPIIEIIIAILLAVPKFRMIGLFASFSLMIMFTTYIIIIMNFSYHIPCSCGGVLENLNWTQHLVFNIGFDILAIIGIVVTDRDKETQERIQTDLGVGTI